MKEFIKRLWQGEDNHRIVISVNIHENLHDKVYDTIKEALGTIPELNVRDHGKYNE